MYNKREAVELLTAWGLKRASRAPIRRFATNFDRLDRFFLPLRFFASRVSPPRPPPSVTLSLSLFLRSFVFSFSRDTSVPPSSSYPTILVDASGRRNAFCSQLPRSRLPDRAQIREIRNAGIVALGLHSYVLAVDSRRCSEER